MAIHDESLRPGEPGPAPAQIIAPGQKLLTEDQVSRITGLAMSTLRNWRSKKITLGPPWVRVGSNIRYRTEEVDQWLEALPRRSTAA